MTHDYDGFNSKLKLQKAYYCAMDNIQNNYKFIDYKFGPFTFGMHDQIQALYEINWINQEQYKHFGRIEVNPFEINKNFSDNFNVFIEFLKKKGFFDNEIEDFFKYDLGSPEKIKLALSLFDLNYFKKIFSMEEVIETLNGEFEAYKIEEMWQIFREYKLLVNKRNTINLSNNMKRRCNSSEYNTFEILNTNFTTCREFELVGTIKSIKNTDLNLSNEDISRGIEILKPGIFPKLEKMNGINKFNEKLELKNTKDITTIYNYFNDNCFWKNIILSKIDMTEAWVYDFKQTLDFWNHPREYKRKHEKQIQFCEAVASFANNEGGLIIIGITDKIPRRIIGVEDIENKLETINKVINKYIDYRNDFFKLKEIVLQDSKGINRRCVIIIISQTKYPVGVLVTNQKIIFPIRNETGKKKEDFHILKLKKYSVKIDNYNFLNYFKKPNNQIEP